MTERRKKEKKKKGQAVVSLLRMVLLLGCCRGGTSAREDDCDKTLHDRNRTRTMKIKKKPKKSFFSGALGLFRKSGAGTNGRNDDTGVQNQVWKEDGEDNSGQQDDTDVQTQVCNEKGEDISGQQDDTGVQTQVYKGNKQEITGPNDDTGVQTLVTGPSSSTYSQMSTNGHQGSSLSSVENGTEKRRKVTFAADLHPIPGPSNHDDLHSKSSLLESPESCVDNLKKTPIPPFSGGREQSWNKGKNPAVTPDLHKPRPGPSHTSTTTLPTRTESTGSRKLTKEHDDDHLSTPSNGYRENISTVQEEKKG
ncbi:hypothetical protein MHYP_G00075510 [Metynnis hypsauchen]